MDKIQKLIQGTQGIIQHHYSKTGHGKFQVLGGSKNSKIEGVYCKDCKKMITVIKVVTK